MSSPWPVLLVAALGVVGTLGAAISAQILTTRREERRWSLEREREQERWERERDDRTAQWRREDELRHHEAREEVYTRFMQALWSWGRKASRARRVLDAGIDAKAALDIGGLIDASLNAVDIMAEVELAASTPVRDAGRECCDLMYNYCLAIGEDPIDPAALLQLHDTYKVKARRTVELMRADRGVAPVAD